MFKVKEIRTGLEEVANNEKCSIIKMKNEKGKEINIIVTDEDIEEIVNAAFTYGNTPWIKDVCPKEKEWKETPQNGGGHVVNNGTLILVNFEEESYTLDKNKVLRGIAALIEQEELEDCLRVFKADETFYCKDPTDKTKVKECASIHLITDEIYDNKFLTNKMIKYGIFGKLVFG